MPQHQLGPALEAVFDVSQVHATPGRATLSTNRIGSEIGILACRNSKI
jgi:hypothetical protein